MTVKPVRVWCIIDKYGDPFWGMLMPTRSRAIARFIEWNGGSWKRLYRQGYRAVEVEVREIPKQ